MTWITLAEAAELSVKYGRPIAASTLKIQAQAGRLSAQKLGRAWVTTESRLRKYIDSKRTWTKS